MGCIRYTFGLLKTTQINTHVPWNYYEENHLPHLGNWVNAQRFLYRHGKLLEKRVEGLNSIDFEWEVK